MIRRQVVALVDERAPEGVRTLNARAGGGEFGGDIDGDEAASWREIWFSYVQGVFGGWWKSSGEGSDKEGKVRTLRSWRRGSRSRAPIPQIRQRS